MGTPARSSTPAVGAIVAHGARSDPPVRHDLAIPPVCNRRVCHLSIRSSHPRRNTGRRSRPRVIRSRVVAYLATAWGLLITIAADPDPAAGGAAALYTTIPLLAFARWRGSPFHRVRLFRLLVVRPVWYVQLLLPVVAASAVVGLLAGLPLGNGFSTARALARRGDATLAFVGTGDPAAGPPGQSRAAPDVDRALARVPPGVPVIALAHNPTLFPALAQRGVALTLSGQTHWGQLALPARKWSLASPFLERAMGGHRVGDAVLYVAAGTG